MIEPVAAVHAINFVVALIAASLAFHFVLRPAIIDSFRQRIFAIRRDALLLVADGVVDPSDREYVITDLYLNNLLRFAERLTFMRFVVGMWVYGLHERRRAPLSLGFDETASKTQEARDKLRRIRFRATERVMWHIFEMSPLAWITVGTMLPVVVVKDHTRKLRVSILRGMARALPERNIEREVASMTECAA